MLLLLSLFACADDVRESDIMALSGDATAGQVLYEDNCVGCHGPDGSGYIGPNIQGDGGAEAVQILLYGEDDMPAYDSWSNQEVADVVAFVETL